MRTETKRFTIRLLGIAVIYCALAVPGSYWLEGQMWQLSKLQAGHPHTFTTTDLVNASTHGNEICLELVVKEGTYPSCTEIALPLRHRNLRLDIASLRNRKRTKWGVPRLMAKEADFVPACPPNSKPLATSHISNSKFYFEEYRPDFAGENVDVRVAAADLGVAVVLSWDQDEATDFGILTISSTMVSHANSGSAWLLALGYDLVLFPFRAFGFLLAGP